MPTATATALLSTAGRLLQRHLPVVLWLLAGLVAGMATLSLRQPAAPPAQTLPALMTEAASWPDHDVFMPRPNAPTANSESGHWQLHAVRDGPLPGAIISHGNGRQMAVRTGDVLPSGTSVLQIDQDGVVIDDSTGRHHLQLQKRARMLASPAPDMPTPEGTSSTVAPTSSDGHLLRAGTAELSLLALAGLRAGDRLLSINGQAVGSGTATTLRQQLTRGQTVQLHWQRDGQTRSSALRIP